MAFSTFSIPAFIAYENSGYWNKKILQRSEPNAETKKGIILIIRASNMVEDNLSAKRMSAIAEKFIIKEKTVSNWMEAIDSIRKTASRATPHAIKMIFFASHGDKISLALEKKISMRCMVMNLA